MTKQVERAPERRQAGEEVDFVPPWMGAASFRFGHARMKKVSETLLAATVGFAIGAFGHLPIVAKLGTIGALLIIATALALYAQRSLWQALEIQKNAIASMKIRDLAIVDLTTGKVTPPETDQSRIPTEPAPPPTKE